MNDSMKTILLVAVLGVAALFLWKRFGQRAQPAAPGAAPATGYVGTNPTPNETNQYDVVNQVVDTVGELGAAIAGAVAADSYADAAQANADAEYWASDSRYI